jgi:hypothetical protein
LFDSQFIENQQEFDKSKVEEEEKKRRREAELLEQKELLMKWLEEKQLALNTSLAANQYVASVE